MIEEIMFTSIFWLKAYCLLLLSILLLGQYLFGRMEVTFDMAIRCSKDGALSKDATCTPSQASRSQYSFDMSHLVRNPPERGLVHTRVSGRRSALRVARGSPRDVARYVT